MIESPCPSVCNNRARRIQSAYKKSLIDWAENDGIESLGTRPGSPDIVMVSGEPVFCRSCSALIRNCLLGLDDQMALLFTMGDGYLPQNGKNSQQVRSSRSTASPSPAQDELDDLIRWLLRFESEYRATQGWTSTPYHSTNIPSLTRSLSWLNAHLDAVLRVESLAAEFGLGVMRKYWVLQDKTSTRPSVYHKPLPCPRCTLFSLFRHDDESIRCHSSGCNRIMLPKEYESLESQAVLQINLV